MKRRKFLIALGAIPPLVLEACKKDDPLYLPSIITIVKGKVIDENNAPVEGWGFTFGGYTGNYPPVSTFREDTKTDKDGNYSYSVGVPQTTVRLEFGPVGFINQGSLDSTKTRFYNLYFEKDGKFEPFISSPYPITGESNIFNFQIKKK